MKEYTRPEMMLKLFAAENIVTDSTTGPTSVELVEQSMKNAGIDTTKNKYVITF